jgi:sulfur-carrier protein
MSELELEGGTVGEILNALAAEHPETGSQLFAGDGELNRYVNVYVNDEDVRVQQGLQTDVKPGDTVVILPAMAGGSAKYRASSPLSRLVGPTQSREFAPGEFPGMVPPA